MRRFEFETPFDYRISRYSGFTGEHYQEIFKGLTAAIIDNASPGCARQIIPGPRSHHGRIADELEGFTRSFIMAGPWLNAADKPQFDLKGTTYDVAGYYRTGILNGTDPGHPEYWGEPYDFAQHLVEMASLAWSLYLSRDHIWESYSPAEQQQVADYLYRCTRVQYHPNNWLLFNVITNAVLKKLGMPYSQEQIDANISACEHMYMGDGWFRDGNINRIDYYNAWAFHYYYLIYALLEGEEQSEAALRYQERAKQFVEVLPYFVGGDGAVPCFGRSMIYRFGFLAPAALGYRLESLDMPVGRLRTLFNMSLKFFFTREILTDKGHLSMGFLRPAEGVLEHYNCGGSPYWAVKALNILMIPQEDPFWTADEEPLPIHDGSFSIAMPAAGLLLTGDAQSGHVQLINHKSYHDKDEYNAKYTNLAYSSIFSYDSRAVYGSFNADSSLQWSEDGINFHQRWEMENLHCEPDFAASRYPLHKADPEGEALSFTVMKDGLQIHIHRVTTSIDRMRLRQGGYPLGFDAGAPRLSGDDCLQIARIEDRYVLLSNLYGFDTLSPARPFHDQLNGVNTRHIQSITQRLDFLAEKAGTYLLIAASYANRGNESDSQLKELLPSAEIRDDQIRLSFRDGEEVLLNSGAPCAVESEVGGCLPEGTPRLVRARKGRTIQTVQPV